MAQVALTNIVKNYGKTRVIHGVDLTIETGEFVVFVGPSGCGKSTLLRMIAGLEEITGGDLAIGDDIVNDVDHTGPKAHESTMATARAMTIALAMAMAVAMAMTTTTTVMTALALMTMLNDSGGDADYDDDKNDDVPQKRGLRVTEV